MTSGVRVTPDYRGGVATVYCQEWPLYAPLSSSSFHPPPYFLPPSPFPFLFFPSLFLLPLPFLYLFYTTSLLALLWASITHTISPHTHTHTHIAFPVPNPTIPLKYTAHIGSTAVINCPFRAGALVHRYQASWSKGLQKITPRLSHGKYQVLRNLSLVVTDVNVSDASRGYYCSVTVDDLNDVFHQEAPSVELEVYGMWQSCGRSLDDLW